MEDTTLRLRVDASQINALQKTIKDTFDQGHVKGFESVLHSIDKVLAEQVTRTKALTEALHSVDQGSSAYKKIVQELREANEAARTLQTTYGSLDQAQKRLGIGPSGTGGGGGRGGFGGFGPLSSPAPISVEAPIRDPVFARISSSYCGSVTSVS